MATGQMDLHEALGAIVGAGIGAMRAGLDRDVALREVHAVSTFLRGSAEDLVAGVEKVVSSAEVAEAAANGARRGVSGIALWDRLACSRSGPVGDRELLCIGYEATAARSMNSSGWPSDPSMRSYYAGLSWPPKGFSAVLPRDEGVTLGDVEALYGDEFDAVVSLCRMGAQEVPVGVDHVEVWLVDDSSQAKNPNLDFVLRDVARTIGLLRDEDKNVFVHCVRAEHRTPTAAAAYLAERFAMSAQAAMDEVSPLMHTLDPFVTFGDALRRIWP